MSLRRLTNTLAAVMIVVTIATASVASAQTRLKNICRVKGQEENTLHGMGLVTGLDGTGDGSTSQSTIRALATAMQFMGNPVPPGEIKEVKNVALVMVTATVPAAGARQGDRLDCTISTVGGASSLSGGQLYLTPMLGPRTTGDRVFAMASGPVMVTSLHSLNTGKVIRGCQLEEDFRNEFIKDGKVTLVLDQNKADFKIAQDVADQLNSQTAGAVTEEALARAIDQVNIEVTIPAQYLDNPVEFIADIMERQIRDPATEARVVINRAANTVVVTGDTTIGATTIRHDNISVETGAEPNFIGLESPESDNVRLKSLVKALQAVRADTQDIADILLGLSRSGKLHAKVILE